MSLQKTEEKMIGCADYLTSTEIQTLQQMRDAAAFFTCTCTPDTAIKLFTNPRGGGSEICVHIFRSMYKANHRIILRLIENSFSWLRMEKTRLFSVFPIEECHESFIPIRLVWRINYNLLSRYYMNNVIRTYYEGCYKWHVRKSVRTLKSDSHAQLVKTQVPVPIKSIMLIILIIVVSLVIMVIYSFFFVSSSVNNYYFLSGTTEAYLVRMS